MNIGAEATLGTLTETNPTILVEMAAVGVVPVIELETAQVAVPLFEALLAGGCRIGEVTLRSAAGIDAISILRGAYPEALIGAGTVRTLADAHRAASAGAQFVVSPATNPDLIGFCRSIRLPVIPGACTPTEIDVAVRGGADAIKFFPAEIMGGIQILEALRGPFAGVSFIPTGGINSSNLAGYLRLPNVLACGGSWFVAPSLLAEKRFDRIEALTREAVAIAAQARAEGAR